MEPGLLVVLAVYLVVQGVENLLSYLNLRYLARHGDEVPAGFEGRIDAGVLARMSRYTLAHSKVDFVGALAGMAVTLVFLFGGGLNWYNNLIAGRHWPLVVSGVVFFLGLVYGETLLKIPFSLYNTFYVEKRFGFNRQTLGLWCIDAVKGLLLNTVLLGLLLAGVFWLIQAAAAYWWLLAWGFLLFFSLFVMYISPYVIEPLFNTFKPIEDQALEKDIRAMMRKAGLSVSRVFTMDASKRSSHSNAYFSGIGHVKRIVLFDTLLAASSKDEILAILAHEAGHWKKKHIMKRLVLMESVALVGMYAAYRLVGGDGIARLFGIEDPTLYVKLLLAGFLGSLLIFFLKPLGSLISRRHEQEADDFAVELSGKPQALARVLITLGRDNLANLHPHPWYAACYYSHPPLPERVARLLAKGG